MVKDFRFLLIFPCLTRTCSVDPQSHNLEVIFNFKLHSAILILTWIKSIYLIPLLIRSHFLQDHLSSSFLFNAILKCPDLNLYLLYFKITRENWNYLWLNWLIHLWACRSLCRILWKMFTMIMPSFAIVLFPRLLIQSPLSFIDCFILYFIVENRWIMDNS